MKKTSSAKSLLLGTVLLAVGGAFLRAANRNGVSAVFLCAAAALTVVLVVLRSLALEKAGVYERLFAPSVPALILQLLGAVILAVGGISGVMHASESFVRILGVGAILSAACLGFSAIDMQGRKKSSAGLYIVMTLFYVVKLFYEFRRWEVDPSVLDYCFRLFASICFMLCSYHAAEACFLSGKRVRLSVFALCGVFFGAVSLPDLTGSDLLQYAGSTLWMLSCAWHMTAEIRDDCEKENET